MRRFLWVFLSVSFFLPSAVFTATYNGKKIDNKHFPAKLKLINYFPEKNPFKGYVYDYGKDNEYEYKSYGIYDVDVVFVGKAARIAFNPNNALPLPDATQKSLFLTLYLLNEEINNPSQVRLKHTLNTSDFISINGSDPEKFPTIAIWMISLNMNEHKGRGNRSKNDFKRRMHSESVDSLGVIRKTEYGAAGYRSRSAFLEVHADCNVALVAYVKNLHYPSETNLSEVVEKAESNLTGYHYRKAIQKVHPDGILPDKVDKVTATAGYARDVKGFDSGIVVDAVIKYCIKVDIKKRRCNGRMLTAYVENLHYPSETNLSIVVKKAESSLTSFHYRKAIRRVHPHGILPDRVDRVKATARHGRDVKGFESGVVVDAKIWYCLKDY